jgi:outer membrane protein assembly factor BamB
MAVAGDRLVLAGPPDTTAPQDALAALDGREGGVLWLISMADGRKVAQYQLDSPPVFDGLAVARGRLYWSDTDGHLRCYAEAAD